jgi:tetratricopeptide (TPR) repeat protein
LRHDRRLDARPRQIAPAAAASDGPRAYLAPAVVGLITLIAFLPSLANGFVAWDDDKNFLNNPHFRGFSPDHLHWMWTTFHLGHYVPLTWMTLGLDYTVWGMRAAGYHFTSSAIHAINAVLLYFVARRLLRLAFGTVDPGALTIASAITALTFAVHPLRVESVVWITERRDVLSGFFYLASLLCYLRAVGGERLARGRYAASVVLFACALLSKATAVSLPVALLVVNVYPLRRVPGFARQVIAELTPFVLLATVASVLSIVALHPPAQLDVPQKLAVSAYGLVFYLAKTLLPRGLSPLYELPQHVDPIALRYLICYIVVVVITAAAWIIRRRSPGTVAALAAFFVAILPMLGVVQNGPQITADRYTYFAAPALALLAGAAYIWASRVNRVAAARFAAVALVAVLTLLTWRQTLVWRSTRALWTRVLALDSTSSIAHVGMATLLLREDQVDDAAEHARRAVALAPDYPQAHNDMGVVYARQGDIADAIREYERAVELDPKSDEAHSNLGVALAAHGDLAGAIEQYETAVALNPDAADAHVDWGNSLVRAGHPDEAIDHYRAALAIRPDHAEAELNWGVALALERKYAEAVEHFRRSLEIDPGQREARVYLDRATRLMSGS